MGMADWCIIKRECCEILNSLKSFFLFIFFYSESNSTYLNTRMTKFQHEPDGPRGCKTFFHAQLNCA